MIKLDLVWKEKHVPQRYIMLSFVNVILFVVVIPGLFLHGYIKRGCISWNVS